MQFRSAALFLIAATTAAAQAPTLAPNAPVRVDLKDRSRIDGILTSQTADSVFVWTTTARANQAIAWNSVARVRINLGRSYAAGARKGLRRGALIGSIAGGGLMLVGGVVEGERVENLVAYLILGTGAGAASGALYGAFFGAVFGAERWETVYSRPAASPARSPGGPAVGVSLRF